ncbi:hypothetical protein [Wolbachia endosymbiont (group E) of Neria commutata]|uniref:hypothetical protein n=1 Tax=Wolbachia endosymbiont (group E) of Neria commutata TaxID=3066149 RepID=UPI003132FA43
MVRVKPERVLETGKDTGETGKGTGGETGKDGKDETGKGTSDDDAAAKKKAEEDAAKKKVEEEEDTNKEAGTIMPEEITLDHTEAANCGSYSGYYKSYSQVGRDGFHTHDILKALHPEMFANPKIAPHIEKGAHGQYGAVNYIFDFTSPINFSWGSPSNCTDTAAKNHPSCQ